MMNLKFLMSGESLPEPSPLSPEIKQFLQQQTITENSPGTILTDWQTLLNFIGDEGIEVGEKKGYFSMKTLSEINSRLSRPIEIDLKRPQQKSYPYIHGLYLILRFSGLAYLIFERKKSKIIIDKKLLQSWEQLNQTERYFILLEIWMLWANEEALEGYAFTPNFFLTARLWQVIPDKGIKITAKNEGLFDLHHSSQLTNLALLNSFGLIVIEQGKPQPGKGWRITRLEKTAFGEAILQVLFRGIASNINLLERQDYETISYGKLQPVLKEIFPDYQNQFVVQEAKEAQQITEGIYIFKVSIDKVWRRIAIPSHLTLEPLVDSILDAFDFGKDHLYRFICRNRVGRIFNINHPYIEDEPPFTNKFRVGELPLQVGETMIFNFDFGDDWEFAVLLEAINPPDKKIKKPKLLESHGEAPPQYWDDEEDFEDDDEEWLESE